LSSDGWKAHLSRLDDYIERARAAAGAELEVHTGELRSPLRAHLLPGVTSARIRLKQRDFDNTSLLERYAEPLAVWADRLAGERNFTAFTDWAWQLAVQNHPHDSICGCSIDAVHQDMEYRFDQVERVARRTAEQALRAVAVRLLRPEAEPWLESAKSVVAEPHLGHEEFVPFEETAQSPQPNDNEAVPPPLAELRSSPPAQGAPILAVYNPTAGGLHLIAVEVHEDDPEGIELRDADGAALPAQIEVRGGETILDLETLPAAVRSHLDMLQNRELLGYFVNAVRMEREGSRLHVYVTVDRMLRGSLDVSALREDWLRQLDDDTLEAVHVVAAMPAAATVRAVAELRGFGITPLRLERDEAGLAKHPGAFETALRASSGRTERWPDPFVLRSPEGVSKHSGEAELVCSQEGLANHYYSVEINPDGSLAVFDKQLGLTLPRCNAMVDEGDRGDEYNFDRLLDPQAVTTPVAPPHVTVLCRGPVAATVRIEAAYSLPARLEPDRETRSAEHITVPVETLVTIYAGLKRIDFTTTIDQRADDHRLRVCFETPLQASEIHCEQAFTVVDRALALGPGSRFEQPIGTVPQKTFSAIEAGGRGVALFNRGIPEIEAIASADATTLALTLVRAVGWLSRGDLRLRNGHAGPGLATPGAQCHGRQRFEYALSTYAGDWQHAGVVEQAHAYAYPPLATVVDAYAPRPAAPFELDNPHVVVSAVTPARRGAFHLRLYNPTRKDQVVELNAPAIARVVAVDLLERPRPARLVRLRRAHGGWRLILAANEIATLKMVSRSTM